MAGARSILWQGHEIIEKNNSILWQGHEKIDKNMRGTYQYPIAGARNHRGK